MNAAMSRIAGAASGVSRGSAWKTCTWSGQTCSSQSPPAARDVGGERVERRRRASRRRPPGSASAAACVRPRRRGSAADGEIGSRAVQPDRAAPRRGRGSPGRGRSCSRARASPKVRSTSGDISTIAAGCATSGCSSRSTARCPPAESPAMTIRLGCEAAARCTASPSRPAHRRRRWGIGDAAPAGSRRRTPAARSAGTARPSAGGGCAASTARTRCRARSRWLRSPASDARRRAPIRRRPGGRRAYARRRARRWVPASEGPKVSMTRATIWRDAHSPQARSGGSTALICRRVRLLTRGRAADSASSRGRAS